MRQLGVRELRTNLSSVLHGVGAGEPVRVTLHGRPVADIVPAGSSRVDEGLRELIAEGRIAPAARPRPPRPPRPVQCGRSASEIVLAEREDDR